MRRWRADWESNLGLVPEIIPANKFHAGNGGDGKHYWLTPPDLYAALDAEFHFDFDPCPYPLPDGFDGLTCEWGQSNYVNPPFGSILHDGKLKGATAWVRKAIAEHRKGKTVVFVYPIDKWVLMLLAEIGAEVRNLRDVRWLATEDGSAGNGTGRHIACFVLRCSVELEIEAWRTGSHEGHQIEPTPTIDSYRLALAMHEAKKVGGPWTPCGPDTDFGAPFDCECAAMGKHLAGEYDTWLTDPSLADRLADKLRGNPAIQQLTQSRVYSGSPSAYAGPTGDAAVHYHEPTDAIPSGYGHQHAHNGAHEHTA